MSCWWNDPGELSQLLYWLQEQGSVVSADDVIAVVEKPWRFSHSYTDMAAEMALERRLRMIS